MAWRESWRDNYDAGPQVTTLVPRYRCRAGLVASGDGAEPAQVRLPPLVPSHSFRAVVRGGSEPLGAGAALVPDDGYRVPLGERGAGGERQIEPGCAQPLADPGHQLGLRLPQMRPRR